MKKNSKICKHNAAIISAYRFQFENASALTFDDRPQVLKDLDKERKVTDPCDKNPYRYSDSENQIRNRNLKAFLLQEGYGICHWRGGELVCIGSIGLSHIMVKDAFLVVDIKIDSDFYNKIFSVAEYFNQSLFHYYDDKERKWHMVDTRYSINDELIEEYTEPIIELHMETLDDYEDNDKNLIKQFHDDICANMEKMKSI